MPRGEEQLSLRAPGQVAMPPGTRVAIAADRGDIHLFDAGTGLRVERAAGAP